VSLDAATESALSAIAAEMNMSRTELIRMALVEWMQSHKSLTRLRMISRGNKSARQRVMERLLRDTHSQSPGSHVWRSEGKLPTLRGTATIAAQPDELAMAVAGDGFPPTFRKTALSME
jgi:hypothetical protein